MGTGSKRNKNNNSNMTIDLEREESFKSVNTTIQHNDFDCETKKSLLKKFGSIPGAGILLAAMSSVCFATGSLCCRILGDEVNSNQVVIARSLLQFFVYLVVAYWKNSSLLGVKNERWPLFLRAFLGFVTLSGNYTAIQMIGLSDASAIVFSSPVFCVFFAFFLIGEPFRCNDFLTLIMVIFGIILICKPEILIEHHKIEVIEEETRLFGSMIAFVACLANSMVFITLPKLKKTSSQVSIIWFSLVSIFCATLLNAFFFEFNLPETNLSWLLLLVNGFCGVFGQLFLTLSLKITKAGPVSMARTLVLHQPIEWHTILGAILTCVGVIITSVGVPIYNKIRSNFAEKQSDAPQTSN